MRKLSLLFCSLMLLALAACGSSDKNAIPEATGGSSGGGGDAAPAATASITGKISFEGEVPKPEKIQTSADPNCTKPLTTEGTIVKDGGLGNVFIYVSGGFEGKSFAPPSTPVEINQMDCHYIPHAVIVSVGQTLNVRNSDMTLHNIHAQTVANSALNTGQAVPMVTPHVFDKKEILIPVKCDVHKWMGAFIAVVDNPFATISAEDGKYELKLPAGKFEITAIHEKYGMQKMMVEVKDGDKTPMNFTFKASDAKSGN
jgi:plastocyanin